MNLSGRCRLCLTEYDDLHLKSMFIAWNDSINLWTMYDYLMNVGENVDAALIPQICVKCEENLRSAYFFKLMCSETEKSLGELTKNNQISFLKSDNESYTECVNFDDSYCVSVSDNVDSDITEVCGTQINEQNYWNESIDDQIVTKVDSDTVKRNVLGRKCKVCNLSFENIKSYQVHYRQVHSNAVSKTLCSYCGKFVSRQSIDKHLKNCHSSDKIRDHLCTICGNSFTLVENLKKHLRIHSNDKR